MTTRDSICCYTKGLGINCECAAKERARRHAARVQDESLDLPTCCYAATWNGGYCGCGGKSGRPTQREVEARQGSYAALRAENDRLRRELESKDKQ